MKDIQKFDAALAKQLLTEAGFPNGANFPKQELWLRNETPLNQAVGESIRGLLKQNLGIEIEVSNKDRKRYRDNLLPRRLRLPRQDGGVAQTPGQGRGPQTRQARQPQLPLRQPDPFPALYHHEAKAGGHYWPPAFASCRYQTGGSFFMLRSPLS